MAAPSQRARCVSAYLDKGFTREEAERICSKYPDDAPKPKSSPKPKTAPTVATWTVAVGSTSEKPNFWKRTKTEQSMAAMGGRGWRLATGNLGTGAVVFPDPAQSASDFATALGRPVKASDLDGWREYARRLSIPEKAAESAWRAVVKAAQKPLKSALEDLRAVFGEELGAMAVPVTRIFTPKMTHGGPQIEPPPNGTVKKIKDLKKGDPPEPPPDPGVPSAPEPSFPYHTKEAGKVWKAALALVDLYPTEGPADILKRALSKAGVKGIEITPEDEKLLQMAIHFAQNGPPRSLSRIGGMPGGPFDSTGYGHSLAKIGSP
jgi:hypothetical protein